MDYMIWQANPAGGYCTLEDIEKVPDSHELKRGISRAADFPESARFRMNRSHPKEIKLADNIFNRDRLLVVSTKLKDFVASRNPPSTEFLPVTIYNHKNRVAAKDYYIINPLSVQDCIDQKNSKIVWNAIDPELIASCMKLVIDAAKLEGQVTFLRPKYLPTIVLVRQDLVDDIQREGFTGTRFISPSAFMQ